MKHSLLIALLFAFVLTSCKKDRTNEGIYKRPTSVTTTGPVVNQKMDLKYEGLGTLKELQYYNNDKLIAKIVYQNQNGVPATASIYGSVPGGEAQLVAVVSFAYTDQRLRRIALQPKVNFLIGAASYDMTYTGGQDPQSKVFILGMISSSISTGPITSIPIDPATGMEINTDYKDLQTFSYEFDTKVNPFYGLPVISAMVGNNAMASFPMPIFGLDGAMLFSKHNVILRKWNFGTDVNVYSRMEYTYDSQGYPMRIKTFGPDGSTVYSEIVIEY